MKSILFLFLFVILIVVASFYHPNNFMEGYVTSTFNATVGDYPASQTEVLVQDTYPAIGGNQVSKENAYNMWWHYPTFKLGSYAQITNNIRYSNNPDVARCTPADMCYALYKDKYIGTNYVTQLPPVNPNGGRRVGYFNTSESLLM